MSSYYLLDADIFRLYIDGNDAVISRIYATIDLISLSSVTIEEMVVGRLRQISRARSAKPAIPLSEAHEELAELLSDIRFFPITVYSSEAERIFQTFPASKLRIGPQDCRVAAQALAHNLTVVTRNLRHFEAIGAPCEDWSADLPADAASRQFV